jgi:rhomboid protease GluP
MFKLRETWLTRKPDPLAVFVMALVLFLITITSVAYWQNWFGAETWLSATRSQIFSQHQYWRAWTTLLVHGDEKHLLSNLFLFFVMGSLLAAYFGILIVPLMTFLFGGLTNLVVLSAMPKDIPLIGASGMVFWMGGAWLTLYLLLDRQRSRTQRILRSFGVAIALFMPAEAFDPSVSYQSHLLGFIFGIAWALIYFTLKRKTLRGAEVYEFVELDPADPAMTTSEN